MKGDQYVINLFHVLTVAPLLIYIGLREEKTEYLMFDVLAIMGYGLLFHFSKKTYKLLV